MLSSSQQTEVDALGKALLTCLRRESPISLSELCCRLPQYPRRRLKRALQRLKAQGRLRCCRAAWVYIPQKRTKGDIGITHEDLEWMEYWQQLRAQRLLREQQARNLHAF